MLPLSAKQEVGGGINKETKIQETKEIDYGESVTKPWKLTGSLALGLVSSVEYNDICFSE